MSKRQFITYTVTSQTMGESTDEDAGKYAAALQTKLETLYPEHDIAVSVNSRNSSSVVGCSDDVEAGDVHAAANVLWDRGDWKAPEKARPGRKPLPEGAGKTERVQLRLTETDKAAWLEKAAAAGLTLQAWIELRCGGKR